MPKVRVERCNLWWIALLRLLDISFALVVYQYLDNMITLFVAVFFWTLCEAAILKIIQLLIARWGRQPTTVRVPFDQCRSVPYTYDRVDWLNRILEALWPAVKKSMEEKIRSTVEPALDQTSSNPGVRLQLDTVALGKEPVIITGIKVHETNTALNIVVVDVDILYQGDGRLTVIRNDFRWNFKNFKFHGQLRVFMKHPEWDAAISEVSVGFFAKPFVDFQFTKWAAVVNALSFGIIKKRVLGMLQEKLAESLVMPNKYVVCKLHL